MILITCRECKIAELYTKNYIFAVKFMTPADDLRLLIETFEEIVKHLGPEDQVLFVILFIINMFRFK